jgi:putative selenium metabolism hydrolase
MNSARKEQVIGLCRELVRQKSYSGDEGTVVEHLKRFFTEHGFDDVTVDGYGNCIGHIKGSKPGPKILFDGHMDTVPVTDESAWRYPPFGAEIHEGRIHGRGTSDMKGALAAMCCAVADFAADTKKNFAGDLYVSGVVHEECFEGVASRSVSRLVRPDYVVIGEASQLNVKIGQRGRAEIKLEVFGKAAHSANPEKGINAVYQAAKIIREIQKLPPPHHEVLGDGILELTDIKSSPYPGASVVPEYCAVTYDRRLLTGETPESVLKPIQALLVQMKDEDSQLNAKVSYARGEEMCHTGKKITGERFFPGWLYDRKEPFVQDVLKQLWSMGFTPEISRYNFCTNGSHYAGEAGIKTIGLGPSAESLAHTRDEFISIDQLVKAAECYYGVIKAWIKQPILA